MLWISKPNSRLPSKLIRRRLPKPMRIKLLTTRPNCPVFLANCKRWTKVVSLLFHPLFNVITCIKVPSLPSSTRDQRIWNHISKPQMSISISRTSSKRTRLLLFQDLTISFSMPTSVNIKKPCPKSYEEVLKSNPLKQSPKNKSHQHLQWPHHLQQPLLLLRRHNKHLLLLQSD